MTFPEQPLTLLEAIDHAKAVGLAVDVMAGFAERTYELLTSLETSDPDPTLSLRIARSHAEIWLSEREQSGPERWEYPHTWTEYRDRLFLRVVGEGIAVDVPLLPAAFGMIESYGFVEDLALSSPARVDRKEFERALILLTQAQQRQGGAVEG